MKSNSKNVLAALAAAAAMPISTNSHSLAAPQDSKIGYRYSQYQEADAPRERTFTPTIERYQIDVHQLHYGRPITGNWYINTDLQYETLTGASPLQTYENTDGNSVLLMTGASIDEQRTDLRVAPTRYFSQGSIGGSIAYSTEDDYQSIALGLEGQLELADQLTTLHGSISVSNDTLSPTDAYLSSIRQDAEGNDKRSVSIYEGISRVLTKTSVVQAGIGYTHQSGYLSDPYKFEDRRPGQRDQVTLDGRYRLYFNVGDGAALHLDYRYYTDDWGIRSHTITTRWAQSWKANQRTFNLIPSLRHYRQTAASFYRLEQNPPDDELSSSDARLSTFGALTYGIEGQVKWQRWLVSLDIQQYDSAENLALIQTSSTETPALVDYQVVSLGIEYRY